MNWKEILLSSLAIGLDYSYSVSNSRLVLWHNYIQYFNPIFILPSEIWWTQIKYNWLEQISFITFKSLYAIILYQLIIAVRRTTKR